MNFIDIFDFTKYFKREGDGKRAKIGHVNAVIEELSGTTTTVNISSAQILAMGTTPIELLPAPGDGIYYDIEKIILEYKHISTGYSIGIPLFIYNNDGDYTVINQSLITGTTDAVVKITDFISSHYNGGGTLFNMYSKNLINKKITLNTWNNSNPTTGDGTLRAIITYTVKTFGA